MGGKNSYESIKRYEDKAYDKVLVRFPKGKKDIILSCICLMDITFSLILMRPMGNAGE